MHYAELLLSDEVKLAEFRKKAFQNAQKFDLKYVLPLYEELYESAMKKESIMG